MREGASAVCFFFEYGTLCVCWSMGMSIGFTSLIRIAATDTAVRSKQTNYKSGVPSERMKNVSQMCDFLSHKMCC